MEYLRPNPMEKSGLHVQHPQFVVVKNNLQNILNGETVQVTQNELQALEIYTARLGRILESSEFSLLDNWSNKSKTLSVLHSMLVKGLKSKLMNVGLFDSNFPAGYLLTVPSRGTVLVNPNRPDHILDFAAYSSK